MTAQNPMIERALRELVARQLAVRWDAFAAEHPELAAAIERVKLIESTVERVTGDPAFASAMEAAGRDEAALAASATLLRLIETWVQRALGLGRS